MVHDEIAESAEEASRAKAAVAEHKAAVGSTLRAVSGALEKRKGDLRAAQEAEARRVHDRVRASSMVMVPAEIAAQINRRH